MKKQLIFISGGSSFSQRGDFIDHLKNATLRDLPGSETKVIWSKNLTEDLGEKYEVFAPVMPNKQNARYDEWKIWFERYLPLVKDGVVLVGWSLGGMFLAKYLAENKLPIMVSTVFLLAAPGGSFVDISGKGEDCLEFLPPTDLSLFEIQVRHIEVWHSEDDFVVPVEEVEWYKNHLKTSKIKLFKDKNHFLVPELPELIAAIEVID